MNRVALNFEAIAHTRNGEGLYSYTEIQILVNSHVVYRWTLDEGEACRVLHRGDLERVVTAKIYGLLHPEMG